MTFEAPVCYCLHSKLLNNYVGKVAFLAMMTAGIGRTVARFAAQCR